MSLGLTWTNGWIDWEVLLTVYIYFTTKHALMKE